MNSGLAKTAKSSGRGAVISGTFTLSEGDEIRIIVGQKASILPAKDYFGGSGGTFVVKYKVSLYQVLNIYWENFEFVFI